MKKNVIILLIFTHLFSAVGFSMNVHDCGGHKSYSLLGLDLGTTCACNHEDEKHSHDCCKDKKVEVKAQKKETIGSKIFTFKYFAALYLAPINTSLFQTYNTQFNAKVLFTGHPPNYQPPLYILNSVFII